jgi:hypothetical protein
MGTREAQAKAARTKAENAERKRQEGAHLATQTEGKNRLSDKACIDRNWTMGSGGRAAKHRALQNAGKLG